MLTSLDYADTLDSYLRHKEIPYASGPAKENTVLDSSESNADRHTGRFFKAILIALPVSASIWGLILLAVVGIFF
jgi:hypothetical protein